MPTCASSGPSSPATRSARRPETLGWRETSKGDTGVVWVRTTGFNQRDERVLQFYRWVMVNKRAPATPTGADDAPEMPAEADREHLRIVPYPPIARFDASATGGATRSGRTMRPASASLHPQGMTIEEAEHQLATRLYQNTARVHFNQLQQQSSRHGRRIVYGGHVISVAHALSFDGLENADRHGGLERWIAHQPDLRRATRCSPGPTCWSASRSAARTLARLRLRLVAVKNVDPSQESVDAQGRRDDGRERYSPSVVLDLEYVALIPKRAVVN